MTASVTDNGSNRDANYSIVTSSCEKISEINSVSVVVNIGDKRKCLMPASSSSSPLVKSRNNPASEEVFKRSRIGKVRQNHHLANYLTSFSTEFPVSHDSSALEDQTTSDGCAFLFSDFSVKKLQKNQSFSQEASIRIKILAPTLTDITEVAEALHTSIKSSHEDDFGGVGFSPLLLSFPTEAVYTLVCCVKTGVKRSLTEFNHTTKSNSFSFYPKSKNHQNGSTCDSLYVHNASLEWMLQPKTTKKRSNSPLLFVCDVLHAIYYAQFSPPKTFVIKPQPQTKPPLDSMNISPSKEQQPQHFHNIFHPLSSPNKEQSERTVRPNVGNLSTPLPLFSKPTTAAKRGSRPPFLSKQPVSIWEKLPNSELPTKSPTQGTKLQAATFSESREAFIRIASKFWPGPIKIYVEARSIRIFNEDVFMPRFAVNPSVENVTQGPSILSQSSSVSSGDFQELEADANCCVMSPILPTAVLVPAAEILNQSNQNTYFVGMQCPSHPLSQKILTELYQRHITQPTALRPLVTNDIHSTTGKRSYYSVKRKASSRKGKQKCNIAIIGYTMPCLTTSAVSHHLTESSSDHFAPSGPFATAAKAAEATITDTKQPESCAGQIYILNGEDTRESFSVPTCQYGTPHPVSLLIDGHARTVHLLHDPCNDSTILDDSNSKEFLKHYRLSTECVRRAMLKPASRTATAIKNEKKGYTPVGKRYSAEEYESIDRVVTAVLSRWKVLERTL